MKRRYFVIGVESSSQIWTDGPFDTELGRDESAREIWEDDEGMTDLFRAMVDENGELHVGPYADDELESDDFDDEDDDEDEEEVSTDESEF